VCLKYVYVCFEQLVMTSCDAATLRELMRLLAVLVARREQLAVASDGQSAECQDTQSVGLLESTLHDNVLLNQVSLGACGRAHCVYRGAGRALLFPRAVCRS